MPHFFQFIHVLQVKCCVEQGEKGVHKLELELEKKGNCIIYVSKYIHN